MRRLLTACLFACALGGATLALPAYATPASANQVVVDCNAHGSLTHAYTPDQLRTALDTMPADVKEYTDCYDLIQRTLLAELGSSKSAGAAGPTGSGGSLLPTPVLVVIAVLAAAAVGLAALALRRRRRTRVPPTPPISEA
jgi:hypothetical protein